MWELTIVQKRKSEYSDAILPETTKFTSEHLCELLSAVHVLSDIQGAVTTEYTIKKVEKGESNGI